MYAYSPDIPGSLVNYALITPETHPFTVLSSWGKYSAFSAAKAIHTVSMFRSTWYPLLLGGQRRCGFKACPRDQRCGNRALTLWSRVQRLNHSATRSTCYIVTVYLSIFLAVVYNLFPNKLSVCKASTAIDLRHLAESSVSCYRQKIPLNVMVQNIITVISSATFVLPVSSYTNFIGVLLDSFMRPTYIFHK